MGKLFRGNEPEQHVAFRTAEMCNKGFFDGERNKASIKGKFSGQALAMQPRLARNLRILLPQRSQCWKNWQLNSPGLKFFYSEHTPRI